MDYNQVNVVAPRPPRRVTYSEPFTLERGDGWREPVTTCMTCSAIIPDTLGSRDLHTASHEGSSQG